MLNQFVGKKVKMTQTYVGDTRVAATILSVKPGVITQIKTEEKDGYKAVQVGFGEKRLKNISKPLQGHLKAVAGEGVFPRYLREERVETPDEAKIGDSVNPYELLKAGDLVTVSAKTKGKGFAGVVKRWDFAGGPKTHGQSNRHRSPGSIGQGTTPGRVWKGKKMAGRMGYDTKTIKNLYVISLTPEKSEILLSGAVPGPRGGVVTIRKIGEGDVKDLIKKVAEIKVKGKTGEIAKE